MTDPSEHDEVPSNEEPPYSPPVTGYDPGAALVEENPYYGHPETGPGPAAYPPGAAESATYDPATYDPAAYHPTAYEQASYDPAAYGAGAYDPGAAHVETPYPHPYASSGGSYEPPAAGGIYDEAPAPPPVVPPRGRAPRKKAVPRTSARKPAGGPARPSPRRPAPKPVVYGGGVSPMTILLFLVALGMLAVVVMVGLPKDLSQVAGYPPNPVAGAPARNLLAEVQKVMIDRNAELVFTEEEVNRYLGQRLSAEQSGPLASLVKFRGVCIDFSPGQAEVVIEREIFGQPLTLSVDLAAEEFRRQMVYKPTAWHIGKISLGSRTVKPVVDLFTRLRGSLADEHQSILQMTGVRFEDNRVVLDARI